MPKVWLTWDARYHEWKVWDDRPSNEEQDVVEVEMNASLRRQIRAAEKKFEKFQNILERFYADGLEYPARVRRVR